MDPSEDPRSSQAIRREDGQPAGVPDELRSHQNECGGGGPIRHELHRDDSDHQPHPVPHRR
jgi:hypothetical protein